MVLGVLTSTQPCSFKSIGADICVTSDPEVIAAADRIVLPGVGAFEDAARKLRESGLDEVIKREVSGGKALLGICLGMQMLFERSYEYGEHEGLGLIKGSIRPISDVIPKDLKIPHIGWNALHFGEKKDEYDGVLYIDRTQANDIYNISLNIEPEDFVVKSELKIKIDDMEET